MTTTTRLERGTYIGGHQIAAIIGMHPYQSIGDVYAQCALGISDFSDDVFNADPSKPSVLRRGRICEAGLVDYVEEVCLGLAPGTLLRDLFKQDEDVPFFAGTIDAAEVDDDGAIVHIHEVTVTSSRAVDKWGTDGDPNGAAKYKWLQDQWYQGISGARGGTVWLFVSDTGEIRRYPVERRDALIETMRNDGEQFWLEHVLPRVPPPLECTSIGAWAVAESSVDAIYKVGGGDELPPTADLVRLANDYSKARDDLRTAEENKRGLAAQLKATLGDNTWSKWEGGRVSWKRNKPREKIDHVAALKQLAGEQGLTDGDLQALLKQHTQAKAGPRILRVNIRADKQEEENQDD